MRRSILAFVMVAIVVAAAQPAGAIDDGFRGPYRVFARESPGSYCEADTYRYRVHIRYVSERVRRYDRFAPGSGGTLRYLRGQRFPWRAGVELRYDQRTDSAVGRDLAPQGCWRRLRLVPIG